MTETEIRILAHVRDGEEYVALVRRDGVIVDIGGPLHYSEVSEALISGPGGGTPEEIEWAREEDAAGRWRDVSTRMRAVD